MTTPKLPEGNRFTADHIALSILVREDRDAAARLLNDLGVPTAATALRRVLDRLFQATSLTPILWALSPWPDLLRRWISALTSSQLKPAVAAHYDDPIERSRSAVNPTRGVMAEFPIYAGLAAPLFEQAVEQTYSAIFAAPAAALLASGKQSAKHSAAVRVAELARRLFQSTRGEHDDLAQRLDLATTLPPHVLPHQGAAVLWLRLRNLLQDPHIADASHDLLAAWASLLGTFGNEGTGFGIRKGLTAEHPVTRTVDPDELLHEGHIIPSNRDQSLVALAPDADVASEVPDDDVSKRQAERLWTASAQAQFLLPGSWHRFTDDELAILIEGVGGEKVTLGNTIIRAGLACGLRPRAIAVALDGEQGLDHFEIVRTKDAPQMAWVARTLTARDLADAFRPSSGDEELYLSADGEIRIESGPIPSAFPGTYEEALDEAMRLLRKDARLRLSEGRVARQLACELQRETEDPYLVDLLLQPSTSSILTGAGYYVGISASKVAARLTFVQRLGGVISVTEGVMGSHGIPCLLQLSKSTEELNSLAKSALKVATDPPGIAAAHNAYVLRVLCQLLIGSSHRLVEDAFPTSKCLLASRSLFVIQDKVVNASHQSRVAVAPEKCIRQWELYKQHLRALSDRLAYHDAPAASRVRALVLEQPITPAPFFFFLDYKLEISPLTQSSFRAHAGKGWRWHDSFHRHLLAWWLRDQGAPPEMIHDHLGHWVQGRAPFSKDSFFAPSQLVEPLSKHIDALLQKLQLEPMEGLQPAGVYAMSRQEKGSYVAWGLLGPEKRAARRETAALKRPVLTAEVMEALDAAAWSHGVHAVNKKSVVPRAAVEQARDALAMRFSDDAASLVVALSALRTRCKTLRNQGAKIMVPGAPYSPGPNEPLLKDPSGHLAAAGLVLRDSVGQWLVTHSDSRPKEDRPAMTFLSAVILGGLIDRRRWDLFANALGRQYHCDGIDWIELRPDGHGGDRFIGDALTRALLRKCPLGSYTSLSAIQRRADTMLRLACAGSEKPIWGLAPDRKPLGMIHVLSAIEDSLALDVSGLALEHMRGDLMARTTSAAHFSHWISGSPRTFAEVPSPHQDADIDPPRNIANTAVLGQQIDSFIESLKRAEADAASDGRDEVDLHRRRQHRLNDLEHDLMQLLEIQKATGTRPALFRLCEYALHLVQNGGVQSEHLSPSTIRKYSGIHVDEIVGGFRDHDPATLDDVERTDVYGKILKGITNVSKEFVDALRYFDWYLCELHDLGPADWNELGHKVVSKTGSPYCDFPTSHELGSIIIPWERAINPNGLFDPNAALSLMSSTGLRSGEAFRLTRADVVTSQPAALRVENKESGETKSRAGVRIAFKLEPLAAAEERRSPASPTAAAAGEQNTALFSAQKSHLPRSLFNRHLKTALVEATGDPRCRPHLLRHGATSYLVLVAGGAGGPVSDRVLGVPDATVAHNLRFLLTGRSSATSLWSDAICRNNGHSKITTSLEYYGHSMDVVVATQLDRWLPDPPRKFLAFVLDLKANTINQRVFRRRRAGLDAALPSLMMEASVDGRVAHHEIRSSAPTASNGAISPPVRRLQPTDIGVARGWVNEGFGAYEVGVALKISTPSAQSLVHAIRDVDALLPPPLIQLTAGTSGPRGLRDLLSEAAALLGESDGTGFWSAPDFVESSDIFLSHWRRSGRYFSVQDDRAGAVVRSWLHLGGIEPPTPVGGRMRLEAPSKLQGRRLTLLLALAYSLAIRNRFELATRA